MSNPPRGKHKGDRSAGNKSAVGKPRRGDQWGEEQSGVRERAEERSDRPKNEGGLEVREYDRFARVEWGVQRVAWVAILLLLAAAAVGAFGNGPFARARARAPDSSLTLDYDRIVRRGSSERLGLTLTAAAATDSLVRLWMDREYARGLSIERITPDPAEVKASDDRVIYAFRAAVPGRPVEVTIDYEPNALWLRRGRLATVGSPGIAYSQLVLP